MNEGMAVLEELDATFRKDKDPNIRSLLAQALMHRALAQYKSGQVEVAIQLYGAVENRLGGDKLPWRQELLSEALRDRVGMYLFLKRWAEMASMADAFDARFRAVSIPEVQARLAAGQLFKAEAMRMQDRNDDELSILDAVVNRFGAEQHWLMRMQLAHAQANKGQVLHRLGRSQEALAAYDRVERDYGAEPADQTRENVAWSMLRKGDLLTSLSRAKEAKLSYGRIVDRYRQSETPALIKIVERAKELLAGKS